MRSPRAIATFVWLALGIAVALAAVVVIDAVARGAGGVNAWLVPLVTALSLLVGLATLVLGVMVAWRRRLRWWRLLAVPLVALGVLWSLLPVGLAWYATHPVRSATESGGVDAPKSAGLLNYSQVSIPTSGSAGLSAWYVPPRNGVVVVGLPGAMSTKASLLGHAKVLVRNGYGVLLVDPRGLGGSTGRPMEYGWWGETDVAAVLEWLGAQPDAGTQIAALGLSMGGEQALTAAARDERIRAVVAEGATHRTYDDVYAGLRGIEKAIGVPQYRVLYGVSDWLSPATPPGPLEEAVARIAPRRVLLLNTAAEAPYARRYAAAAGTATTLWAPASEAHISAVAENPGEWERRVIGFLDSATGVGR